MLAAATARGDRARMTAARQRLERIEEARATLTDPQRRAAYDARCMSLDDHAYNRARYRFIDRLDHHPIAPGDKGKHELVRLMVRAYRQMPQDHMADYFRPDEFDAICTRMIASATRLSHLRELMDRENYDEAYTVAHGAVALLDGWRTATG